MESAKNKLEISITLLDKAVKTLSDSLQEELTDYMRDAIIQRFEYTFELAWKAGRTAAKYMGSEYNSPRDVIRYAFKMGWINSAEDWFQAMDARNNTSHAYDKAIAVGVYVVAKSFPAKVAELLASLKNI